MHYYTCVFFLLFSCITSCESVCTSSGDCDNGGACDILLAKCLCAPGYTGISCEDLTVVDYCFYEPCQNDSTCYSDVAGYNCTCAPCWQGTNCTEKMDPCDCLEPQNECIHSGTCVGQIATGTHVCLCPDGYSGETCEIVEVELFCETLTPCENGANCTNLLDDYNCTCAPFWSGKNCSVAEYCAYEPCQNSGTCVADENGYNCSCAQCYQGTNCSETMNPCDCLDLNEECLNGGSCVGFLSTMNHTCVCPPNFTGDRCQTITAFLICEQEQPCQAGSFYNCTNLYQNYECSCTPEWQGKNCSEKIPLCDSMTCYHGSTCTENDTVAWCLCSDGYSGIDCSNIIVTDLCVLHEPCENNSTCESTLVDYTCNCTDGWVGYNCTEPCICYFGTCDMNGNCTCDENYIGDQCQYLEVVAHCQMYEPCENNGTCTNLVNDYNCTCTEFWTGYNCSIPVTTTSTSTTTTPSTTSSTSTTTSTSTTSSTTTTSMAALCDSFACYHGGTCESNTTEAYCLCTSGFTGDHCEIVEAVLICISEAPCQNNGTCTSNSTDYSCDCTIMWTGQNCTEPITTTSTTTTTTSTISTTTSTTSTAFSTTATTPMACICYFGTCDMNGNCTCDENYIGDQCQYLEVVAHCQMYEPCENNGTCTNLVNDYNCTCTEFWTGYNCSIPVTTTSTSTTTTPSTISSTSTTTSTSTTSSTTTTPMAALCDSFACYHGGTCESNTTEAYCLCTSGFIGEHCEVVEAVLICISEVPCQNNGTCTSNSTDYSCDCPSMWTGQNCTEPITTTSTTTTTTGPTIAVTTSSASTTPETTITLTTTIPTGILTSTTVKYTTTMQQKSTTIALTEKPMCPEPIMNYTYSIQPTNGTSVTNQSEVGTTIVHHCANMAQFPAGVTEKTYVCQGDGTWSDLTVPCIPPNCADEAAQLSFDPSTGIFSCIINNTIDAYEYSKANCSNQGVHLPIMHTQEQWDSFQFALKYHGYDIYTIWIGLKYVSQDTYEWADGTSFTVGTSFDPNNTIPSTATGTVLCATSGPTTTIPHSWELNDCTDENILGICWTPPAPPPLYCEGPLVIDSQNTDALSNFTLIVQPIEATMPTTVNHVCNSGSEFPDISATERFYTCESNGTWSGLGDPCIIIPTTTMAITTPMGFSSTHRATTPIVTTTTPIVTTTTPMSTATTPVKSTEKPMCPEPIINYTYSIQPTNGTSVTNQSEVGTTIVHHCANMAQFPAGVTEKTYVCQGDGTWSDLTVPCIPPNCADEAAQLSFDPSTGIFSCIINNTIDAYEYSKANCSNQGVHLPIMHTQEQWDSFQFALKYHGYDIYTIWIGLKYVSQDTYEWADGTSFTVGTSFDPNNTIPSTATGTVLCATSGPTTTIPHSWELNDCTDENILGICWTPPAPPPLYCEGPLVIDSQNTDALSNFTLIVQPIEATMPTTVNHVCNPGSEFPDISATERFYTCESNGTWSGLGDPCIIIPTTTPTTTLRTTSTSPSATTATSTSTSTTTTTTSTSTTTTSTSVTTASTSMISTFKTFISTSTETTTTTTPSPTAGCQDPRKAPTFLSTVNTDTVKSTLFSKTYPAAFNDFVTHVCNPDYVFIPSQLVELTYICKPTGWFGLGGSCTAITCSSDNLDVTSWANSDSSTNFSSLSTTAVIGTVVHHECSPGTLFSDGTTVKNYTCLNQFGTGTWSPSADTCTSLCTPPSLIYSNTISPTNGSLVTQPTPVGTRIVHQCEDYYGFPGQVSTRWYTCLSNGSFSNVDGECLSPTCPDGALLEWQTEGPVCVVYTTTVVTENGTVETTVMQDSWEVSKTNCHDGGQDMLIIKNENDWNIFHGTRLGYGTQLDNIWIGLRYYPASNEYKYSDGTAFVSSTGWTPTTEALPSAPTDPVQCVISRADSYPPYDWTLHDCTDSSIVGICYTPPPPLPIYCTNQPAVDTAYTDLTASNLTITEVAPIQSLLKHVCKNGAEFPDGTTTKYYQCIAEDTWTASSICELLETTTKPVVSTTPYISTTPYPEFVCPELQVLVGNFCLTDEAVFPSASIFDAAQFTCDNYKPNNATLTLPVLQSETEWLQFKQEITSRNLEKVWVGLRYSWEDHVFRWVADNANILWAGNFAPGEIISDTDMEFDLLHCVYAGNTDGYLWHREGCTDFQAQFICVGDPEATPPQPTRPPPPTQLPTTEAAFTLAANATVPICGPLEIFVGGHCVGLLTERDTFEIAKNVCKQEYSSQLAIAKSLDEWDTLQAARVIVAATVAGDIFKSVDQIWIGLRYLVDEDIWLWSDDTTSTDITADYTLPWAPDEPRPYPERGSENCVYSSKFNEPSYAWRLTECDDLTKTGLCFILPATSAPGEAGPGGVIGGGGVVIIGGAPFKLPAGITLPANYKGVKIGGYITTTTNSTGGGTTTRKPIVKKLEPTTEPPEDRFYPQPMSKTEQTIAIISGSMGCVVILGLIGATIILYLLVWFIFGTFSDEAWLILNQDVAIFIAHIFVLFMREPSNLSVLENNPWLCTSVAILLHYFFMVGYTFMLLESIQNLYIVGYIIPSGHVLSNVLNAAVGWGAPVVLVGITAATIHDEYATSWTCWADLELGLKGAMIIPLLFVVMGTLIATEAAGLMNRNLTPLPNTDKTQLLSANVSRAALPIILLLTVGSHGAGMMAVYFQKFYLYTITMVLNIMNGVAVLVFHALSNKNILTIIKKGFRACKRKK